MAPVSTVTILTFTPVNGSATGGEPLTVTGEGFRPGATVLVGGRRAGSVIVINTTRISATTPSVATFGDVTGDGAVRLVDAICVLRLASKLASVPNCPTQSQTWVVPVTVTNTDGTTGTLTNAFTYQNADVTGDGQVRLVDAICVLRLASKLAAVPNCHTPVPEGS